MNYLNFIFEVVFSGRLEILKQLQAFEKNLSEGLESVTEKVCEGLEKFVESVGKEFEEENNDEKKPGFC